jgi:S-adenosylmethionine:tRNA ribosyltransferase-isomerase
MKRSDFYYDLPSELIAQYPSTERTASRLLVLDKKTGSTQHRQFADLPDFLEPDDLMIFNNTRVIPARLFGTKKTGGKIEIMIERLLGNQEALAHVRASHAPKPGTVLYLENGASVIVQGREDDLFKLFFPETKNILSLLNDIGHIPLPPYIRRQDESFDKERYQTVYGQHEGSVAAPTAGLHYDQKLIELLKNKGVQIGFVTLHVGAGTFKPVKVDDLTQHVMHAEYAEISQEVCAQVKATKAAHKRVIAVGTTAARSLETASQSGEIKPFQGETKLFIYPGYQFKCVDGLQTNFHLPESTLIMLVSAMAGREHTLQAYQAAIAEKYRFFSYGDAMLVV